MGKKVLLTKIQLDKVRYWLIRLRLRFLEDLKEKAFCASLGFINGKEVEV